MDFILANIGNIIVVLIFVVVIAVLLKKGKVGLVKAILFNLVMEATRTDAPGRKKFSEVITELHKTLPSIITLLYTDKDLEKMVDDILDDVKDLLKTNDSKYIRDLKYDIEFKHKELK